MSHALLSIVHMFICSYVFLPSPFTFHLSPFTFPCITSSYQPSDTIAGWFAFSVDGGDRDYGDGQNSSESSFLCPPGSAGTVFYSYRPHMPNMPSGFQALYSGNPGSYYSPELASLQRLKGQHLAITFINEYPSDMTDIAISDGTNVVAANGVVLTASNISDLKCKTETVDDLPNTLCSKIGMQNSVLSNYYFNATGGLTVLQNISLETSNVHLVNASIVAIQEGNVFGIGSSWSMDTNSIIKADSFITLGYLSNMWLLGTVVQSNIYAYNFDEIYGNNPARRSLGEIPGISIVSKGTVQVIYEI